MKPLPLVVPVITVKRMETKNLVNLISADTFFVSHFANRVPATKLLGYEVSVLSKRTNDDAVRQIQALGAHFYDTGIERSTISPLSELRNILRIVKLYKELQPRIVHHYGAKAIFYGTLACFFLRDKPSVVNNLIGLGYIFSSNSFKAKLLRPLLLLGYRFLLCPKSLACRVICENQEDIDFFVHNGSLPPDHATKIPGAGINTDIFCPIEEDQKERICTVIMCCRLLKDKGVYTFIDAARLLKKEGCPVQLWLVGKPDAANPNSIQQSELDTWQHEGCIKHLGFSSDVASLLKKAHIACLPSYYREGLPRALIEGAACGLAIVTTDNVGCRDAVSHHNGILVPIKNPRALADAIKELVLNPDKRLEMARNSRQLALDTFDEKITTKSVVDIYRAFGDLS